MSLTDFAPLVGRSVSADCSPRSVDLLLVEASPLAAGGQGERPPFILIFSSTPEALLITGTYRLAAHGFGPVPVHLAPVAPPGGARAGHYYQAVFN